MTGLAALDGVEDVGGLADPAGDGSIGPDDLSFARSGKPSTISTPAPSSLAEAIHTLERSMIGTALAATGNNHSAAARTLGVSRVGLLKMMTRLGLR